MIKCNSSRKKTQHAHGLYFIGQYLATFTSQRKDSEASFLAGYSFIPKFNPSEKNKYGLMKTYPVSESYSKFKVKSLLFCRNDSKFRGTFEENCHFIQNYPIGDSGPYLQELGLAGDFVDFTNPKIPVVVTAASSNHFLEVQALMQNHHSVVFPI
ncbi:hypothetical protein CHS0354_020246 [Potamilus streckersoni]|uniref:Uncharacterized protein n=1 Tax=Potamilus streckersoni TaxID=2493646 RepID=A0AAE0S5H5_9BIVA|nr:hypothetical protein CHS0354_020246 [Potamilus streckersoni]